MIERLFFGLKKLVFGDKKKVEVPQNNLPNDFYNFPKSREEWEPAYLQPRILNSMIRDYQISKIIYNLEHSGIKGDYRLN